MIFFEKLIIDLVTKPTPEPANMLLTGIIGKHQCEDCINKFYTKIY